MKQLKILLPVLLWSGVCWSYTPLEIDLDNLNADSLDEEHAALNILNERINSLVSTHAILMGVRDLSLLNTDGIKDRSAQWMLDANSSLTRLNALRSILTSVEDLTDSSVRDSFRNQFNLLSTGLVELAYERQALQSLIDSSITQVEGTRTYPFDYIEGEDFLIEGVNSYRADLLETLTGINDGLDQQITDDLLALTMDTRDVSNIMMQSALLEFPELTQYIDDIERLLSSETEVAPRVSEVLNANLEIKSLIQTSYFFTAEDKLLALETKADTLISELELLDIPSDIQQDAIEEISYHVTDAQSFVNTYKSYSSYYVSSLYDDVKQLAPLCQLYEAAQSLYNCSLLGAIAGMDTSAIDNLDDDMLRFIEGKIRQVYAGPLGEVE